MAGREREHAQVGHDLWRFYRQLPIGYHVLIEDSAATAFPGRTDVTTETIDDADSSVGGEGGKAWFRGGLTYLITDTESTIIQAAGAYTTGTYALATDGGPLGQPFTASKNLLEIT